ncbi:MAG: hypothetical protein QOD07_112 [Frankiaceae bacterium]|nr:hypothetical protein [Frankiaceae bacterium]
MKGKSKALVLGAALLVVAGQVPGALGAASGTGNTNVVVLSYSDVSHLKPNAQRTPASVRTLKQQYSALTVERATQLLAGVPIPAGFATVTQVVLPLRDSLLVTTLGTGDGRHAELMTSLVARSSGTVRELVDSKADVSGQEILATATTPLGTQVTHSGRRLGTTGDCTGCSVTSAGSAAGVGLGCLIAGVTGGPAGLICLGIAFTMDVGVSRVCNAQGCPWTQGYPGVGLISLVCNGNECQVDAEVQNPPGTWLTSLGSDILWIYFPGTSAKLAGGGYASEIDDSAYAFRGGAGGSAGTLNEWKWTHLSSERQWAPCSGYVEISITAQYSDTSFYSTGFSPPQPKTYSTSCPGYAAG